VRGGADRQGSPLLSQTTGREKIGLPGEKKFVDDAVNEAT